MEYKTEKIIVRYSETDQMQFVHHSNYLKYFELARLEWLSSLGVSYAEMEQEGILMPVVSATLAYKTPLYYGDEFEIIVKLKNLPKATLEFEYVIVNQKDEIICKGSTILAFLSPNTKRPMRCPKFLLEKFN
ncbi:MAG: acyl-CoA thioesterase [Flavobacteriaceae bacterium]